MCSIWFNSDLYGIMANTTHPIFFTNNFTSFIIWIFLFSSITTIHLSYVIFASLDLSYLSKSLTNSQNLIFISCLVFHHKICFFIPLSSNNIKSLRIQSDNTLNISSSYDPIVKWQSRRTKWTPFHPNNYNCSFSKLNNKILKHF